ncbi:solute carrier family 66 member 3 [Pectinophora gossypiella]|uniref:solute carrier family 66 member 3 n=1 Tax=Pectinophora gossypiella TaxID=13191 RepID=UPI00214EB39D|nr:solute carrier family 66 member 3 [Pectinophora gossypiella]
MLKKNLVENFWFSTDFLKMGASPWEVLANILSFVTIVSCLFLKVPQIQHIRQKRSAEGIYLQAMLMEITGFTIVTLYNYKNSYSIMTYMEYPIILVQIYVMLYYTIMYKRLMRYKVVPISAMTYVALVIGFASGMLPKDWLTYMVPCCTPISGMAKITYIYGIYSADNADAVSLITWMISVFTNSSRLFTVYMDSGDITLMANFTISTLLSVTVLLVALYYQQKHKPRAGVVPAKRRKSSVPTIHRDMQHYHSD